MQNKILNLWKENKTPTQCFKSSQKKSLTWAKGGNIFGVYTCPRVNCTPSALSFYTSQMLHKVKIKFPLKVKHNLQATHAVQ